MDKNILKRQVYTAATLMMDYFDYRFGVIALDELKTRYHEGKAAFGDEVHLLNFFLYQAQLLIENAIDKHFPR